MHTIVSRLMAGIGATIAVAIMGAILITASQRNITASADPTTIYSASKASKCQPQADLHALKAKNLRSKGTLDTADAKVKAWYRTADPRNFSSQVSVADLESTYVSGGRQFAPADNDRRVIVVVSHGSFDAGANGVMGLGTIAGQSRGQPVHMQSDLDVLMLDASSGQFFGEALLFPNCHTD